MALGTTVLRLLLGLVGPLLAAATCTSDENTKLGGPTLKSVAAASYGACCDACIQASGCHYWSWAAPHSCELKASAAGRAAAHGSWSGWAGTGPAPPPPAPPLTPGKWSEGHCGATCEQSNSPWSKSLGRGVSLTKCKAACAAEPRCNYVNHADATDHACIIYASCGKPALCGHTGWDTYQFGRVDSPAWNATCGTLAPPGEACGHSPGPPGPPPGPPAPAPSDPNSFDCKVRLLAMEYAAHVLDGANISAVQASLGFEGGCVPPASLVALGSGRLVETLSPLPAAAATLFVDGSKGSDSNAGTLAAPFKTLQKAQATATAGTTVYLRAGTFHLSSTWRLGPESSGVTWAAYQNEKVLISGGVDLSGLKWRPSPTTHGAFETTLPATMASVPTTLFVNGRRESKTSVAFSICCAVIANPKSVTVAVRAKFPNGDPLIPGGAGWGASASGALGAFHPTGEALPNTVAVKDTSGRLLSSGGSVGDKPYSFTVSAEALPKMTGRGYNPTRQDFHAYANGSAERFNNTWNNP